MIMADYFDFRKFYDAAVADYPGNELFCLVDHAGMTGLHRALLRSGRPWASLFQDSAQESALAAAPLLFPLVVQGERGQGQFLEWLAAHGTYTSTVLMLSSPAGLDTLCGRLARRMHARVSEGMDVLLRYFDPRVFEALLAVFDEEQGSAFLNPADCWWYLDRGGALLRQPSAYADEEMDSPIVLSAAQEFALLDASEIDQVGAQLQSMLPDAVLSIGLAQRPAFLRRHMEAARLAGIAATHEVALYCGLALLYGEEFAQSSPWRELLAKVRTSPARFADLVAAQEESSTQGAM